MILDALIGCVASTTSSRPYVLTCVAVPDCIKIFQRSSRRIVQPPDVDDLQSLGSGLLQRDFRHIQLLNVRKFLGSILTQLLLFKQMSKMSTLGSIAFLVPVHNVLSPPITIFGICRQNDCPARARVHVNSDSIWPARQQPLTFVPGLVSSLCLPSR